MSNGVGSFGSGSLTVFGEQTVGQRVDDVNIQFQYNVSTIATNKATSGTGTVTQSSSRAETNTGTGVGTARITSVDSIRYFPGHECLANFTADFGTPEANVVQQIGLFDSDDGVSIGYNGLTPAIRIRGFNIDTYINQTEWNHDKLDGTGPSKLVWNPQKYNIFQITFGWLGVAPITISIYAGQTIGWIPIHSHDITNNTDSPHFGDPTLPMAMEVIRSSGTGANITLRSSSWRAGLVKPVVANHPSDRPWVRNIAKSISANVDTPILSIRNETTFQSQNNHIRVRLATVSISTDGTKSVTIFIRRGSTLTNASFSANDVNESVVSLDTAATALSGGTLIGGTVLGKVDTLRVNLFSGDVILDIHPGQTLTISAQSTGASDLNTFIRWNEEF